MPIKPGSAGIPLPGIDAAVMTPDGRPCAVGEKGIMVLKRPFPGLTPALWGEPERYSRDYWQRIPNMYYTGDSAHIDDDGYVWVAGRADEIIKIAGHRIGTIEVESAFLKHRAVAECGVIGRPDDTRGEVIAAFVLLKNDYAPPADMRQALVEVVRHELGPVGVIGEVNFVTTLPKTRSGKIMRRVLRAVILDKDPGDITAIEDEGSVDEARHVAPDQGGVVAAERRRPLTPFTGERYAHDDDRRLHACGACRCHQSGRPHDGGAGAAGRRTPRVAAAARRVGLRKD